MTSTPGTTPPPPDLLTSTTMATDTHNTNTDSTAPVIPPEGKPIIKCRGGVQTIGFFTGITNCFSFWDNVIELLILRRSHSYIKFWNCRNKKLKPKYRQNFARKREVFTLYSPKMKPFRCQLLLTSLFVTSKKRKPNVRKGALRLSFCGKNPSFSDNF